MCELGRKATGLELRSGRLGEDVLQTASVRNMTEAFEVAERMPQRRKVSLVGYDLLSKNLQYLKKGLIDFLIPSPAR